VGLYRVVVGGLPDWLDARRLLGDGDFEFSAEQGGRVSAQARLDASAAADLAARLRGVGLGGRALTLAVEPALPRVLRRRALAEEARRYRSGSPGFGRGGVRLDAEGRRSLTPEALALSLGQRAAARGAGRVLDAAAGAGGNAIGFARAGLSVTAIERDAGRLECARHNARVYGVAERIDFVHGDARVLVPEIEADLLFVDPPWGEGYDKQRVEPTALPLLAELCTLASSERPLWAKVPPSFAVETWPDARPEAFFGVGEGDRRRVKFLILELS